jgi:hypothetical protein
VVKTSPPRLVSRAGRPSACSQRSALWPRMIDAVLAVFASKQVAAATETLLQ